MRIPTGSKILDKMLNGGYETDIVTTIYGPAGSGKTTLAILCAIKVAITHRKVIYVDTEGGFSAERLIQICSGMHLNYQRVLEKIVFLKPTTFEEQKQNFERLKEIITDQIGLVIGPGGKTIQGMQRLFGVDIVIPEVFPRIHFLEALDIAYKKGVKDMDGDISPHFKYKTDVRFHWFVQGDFMNFLINLFTSNSKSLPALTMRFSIAQNLKTSYWHRQLLSSMAKKQFITMAQAPRKAGDIPEHIYCNGRRLKKQSGAG